MTPDTRHLASLFQRLGEVAEPAVLLRCLNVATEHYLTVEPAIALRLADALVVGAAWAEQPAMGALGRLGRGDALRRLGRLREAVAAFDEAAEAFRSLAEPDEVGWARTRIGWIVARHELGEWDGVPATIASAMAVFRRHGETLRSIKLATNAGVVAFERAEYEAALAYYDQALDGCAAFQPPRPEVQLLAARVRSNRALVAAELGRFDEALAELEAARALLEAEGQVDSALAQALNIATVQRGMGDYGAALAQLDRVAAAAETAEARAREASARHEQAQVLRELGDGRHALWQAERAQALYAAVEHESGRAAEMLILMAEIHATLGDPDEALELLEVAAALLGGGRGAPAGLDGPGGSGPAAGNEPARLRATIDVARAELRLGLGDDVAAERAAAQAGTVFRALGRRPDAARAGLAHARALVGLGRTRDAAAEAQSVLADALDGGIAPLVAPCHHLLARAALADGDAARSARHLDEALAALDGLTGRMTPDLRRFYRAAQRVYQDAIELRLDQGDAAAAFAQLERSKSPALLAWLTGDARPRPGAAPDGELTQLTRQHHYLATRLRELGAAPRGAAAERKLERLRHELRDVEGRLAEAARRDPARATPGQGPAPVDVDALRAALPAGAALLAYFFAPSRGAVFVLRADGGPQAIALDCDGGQVEDEVAAWRDEVDELKRRRERSGPDGPGLAAGEAALHALARRLYDMLVAPALPHLGGARRLIVLPYGPTHALPFGALHDGEAYLLERFDLSACVSAAVLRLCRERPAPAHGTVTVLGHDWGGRLPGCHAEAVEVAALLGGPARLGREASLAALGAASAGACRVLHVAAHGEARLDNPLLSHVALADGDLTALAAARLWLPGALVTLSACETGHGAVVGGDEVVGLSGAFLAAGASAVVQSLWRIDDAVTTRLMGRFYDGLRQGQPVSAALGAAQRARQAEPGASVVDWAPYQVLGDGAMRL